SDHPPARSYVVGAVRAGLSARRAWPMVRLVARVGTLSHPRDHAISSTLRRGFGEIRRQGRREAATANGFVTKVGVERLFTGLIDKSTPSGNIFRSRCRKNV